MIEPIVFTVLGQAATAGSKRHVGNGILVDSSGAKGKSWRAAVQDAAKSAFSGDLLRCPLYLSLVFYTPRPLGHFGAKGVKASAPRHPAKRPDVLKLARAVEDGLTGVVWHDDAQIVEEQLVKRYGEPARCEGMIREM